MTLLAHQRRADLVADLALGVLGHDALLPLVRPLDVSKPLTEHALSGNHRIGSLGVHLGAAGQQKNDQQVVHRNLLRIFFAAPTSSSLERVGPGASAPGFFSPPSSLMPELANSFAAEHRGIFS